ncbi:hypothetical protein PG997_001654 [Apiospora hydei]|uniref:2EXR domain-containing protein n=1 Tax=Apiospora hydei TaxID=1337664 RepID=A0ABR1XEF3_9PEZI
MASFTCFKLLPPELRQMIWREALLEEVESRLVIVYRVSMRVMPHPSLAMNVMNANRESRNYAQNQFYDVKLDVHTLVAPDLDMGTELAAYV